jgi:hypothetical protein
MSRPAGVRDDAGSATFEAEVADDDERPPGGDT